MSYTATYGVQDPFEQRQLDPPITRIAVAGFKSIDGEQAIEIKPLTLLAGANSSGKSSIMQPLLLLKQTLEISYDPGPLLLNGPNVRFTSAEQLFSRTGKDSQVRNFVVRITIGNSVILSESFGLQPRKPLELLETTGTWGDDTITLRPEMTYQEIASIVRQVERGRPILPEEALRDAEWRTERTRCFLQLRLQAANGSFNPFSALINPYGLEMTSRAARMVIHVPGLRGNPARTYDRTSVASGEFMGTFENYVASIIYEWHRTHDHRLARLEDALKTIGLATAIDASPLDDTSLELRVGRLLVDAKRKTRDMVSIADVGFGVSQTLPVLVALLAAEPGQLVYIEQPEIHLHPRAQVAMAQVLADAAIRGVRVVVETHSTLLLLGVQTLVAEGLSPQLVNLHWFARSANDGSTHVTSTSLDDIGAFDSEWPEDFADVTLRAESQYLDAAEARHIRRKA